MSLGEQLRNARLERNLTASEVAAATRMKIQVVEGLENEDFSKIAAPIYGKGFIKLYAEHVGLDPKPLVDEYVSCFVNKKAPSLQSEESSPSDESVVDVEPTPAEPTLFDRRDTNVTPGGELEVDKEELLHPEMDDDVPPRSDKAAGHGVQRLIERVSDRFEALRESVNTVRDVAEEGETQRRKISLSAADFKSVSAVIAIVVVLVFVISGLSRCVRKASDGDALPSIDSTIEEELELAVEPSESYIE